MVFVICVCVPVAGCKPGCVVGVRVRGLRVHHEGAGGSLRPSQGR